MSGLGIIIATAVSCFVLGMALRELLYEFEHGSRKGKRKKHEHTEEEDEEDK